MQTKQQQHKQLKAHLNMLLEAMQYTGCTRNLSNDQLRELVEREKITFLRKLQAKQHG